MRRTQEESKINCLTHFNTEKHSWFATARKIAYYCTKLVEQPFNSFTTKEKQATFMLIAEVVFVLSSLVTVKMGSKERKYRPQGGKLSFQFGGDAPVDNDNFGGIKTVQVLTDRPKATPDVKVIQRPQQVVKKDKDYPF